MTECMMCLSHGPHTTLKQLPLYVNGSEGLWICHECEMNLVEYVRGIRSMMARTVLEAFKQAKAHNEAKR